MTEDIEVAAMYILPAVGAGLIAWFAYNKLKRSGNRYPKLIGVGIFLACYLLIFVTTVYIIVSQIRLER